MAGLWGAVPLVVLAAAGAVALAPLALWWAVSAQRGPDRRLLARAVAGGRPADLREAVMATSARERVLRPLGKALQRRASGLTPSGLVAALARRVVVAGRPAAWPLERVLAAKLLLGPGALLLAILFLMAGAGGLSLVLVLLMPVLGYFTPDLLLYSAGQKRQLELTRALPDTLDQMTIAVEAGLSFEAAMARAARNGKTALADELARTLQELQIGVARAQAFRNLAERTQVEDIRHFVVAVVQSEAYGVPIAEVLRTQAAEQRLKRRQRAEEQAMKIPVKVIFPLILCILPALFIVLLGPAVIRIMGALGGV